MSLGNFTRYAKVKVTPTYEALLKVSNPLGVAPKLVFIDCPVTSPAYASNNGGVRLCSFWDGMARSIMVSSNPSNDSGYSAMLTRRDTMPSAGNSMLYYMEEDYIAVQAAATASGRWKSSTEYTVHIYA